MVSSLDQLFEAILPATVGKKGLSLHAAEMKTAVFDNLLLYEWGGFFVSFFFLAHLETFQCASKAGVWVYVLDSHTK